MSRRLAQRSRFLPKADVDDYILGVPNLMKPISMHTTLEAEWHKKFAWWPIHSDITNERIWLTDYYEYVITMDSQGAVPKKGKDWRMIYTREEYITKKLKGDINE